jgi:hypothetical protein
LEVLTKKGLLVAGSDVLVEGIAAPVAVAAESAGRSIVEKVNDFCAMETSYNSRACGSGCIFVGCSSMTAALLTTVKNGRVN